MTRLDAFLAHAGLGTRAEVKKLVRGGRVTLDGEPCTQAATQVGDRQVAVDGEVIAVVLVQHLLLHKPVGYACSNKPSEAPLVAELVPPEWSHLGFQPAGRLDRDTSGLLVLSRDGAMIHRLTHPSRKLGKRYRVVYGGTLAADAVLACARGMVLDDDPKPTRPAELHLDAPGRATLLLQEGRTYQVRRMFAALGAEVVELHRDRIGGLDLPADLPAGACRPLSPEQEHLLFGEP